MNNLGACPFQGERSSVELCSGAHHGRHTRFVTARSAGSVGRGWADDSSRRAGAGHRPQARRHPQYRADAGAAGADFGREQPRADADRLQQDVPGPAQVLAHAGAATGAGQVVGVVMLCYLWRILVFYCFTYLAVPSYFNYTVFGNI